MFAALLAALENPAVDAAIVQAGSELVAYFKGLPEANREAAIAQLEAAASSSSGQVAAFDAGSLADLAAAKAQIAALEAAHGSAQATVAALKAELAARALPLEAP